MSNDDSYYNKILGESFELAVKNKKLESKEYKLAKENELLKAHVKELEEQLKRKEQECEELKICIESNEQQVKEVETLIMDNNRLINELDQLKGENDELKKKCNIYTCGICGNKEDCNKLYKTLVEIKFLARELLKRTGQVVPYEIKQILQKISEVENENRTRN